MSAAEPYRAENPADDPGRTLGIVGLVLAIIAGVLGLVISIVALVRSRRAGFRNGIALAGVIVGVITTILTAVIFGVGHRRGQPVRRRRTTVTGTGGSSGQVDGRTATEFGPIVNERGPTDVGQED